MKHLFLPIIFLALFSCQGEHEKQVSFQYKRPKVVEAKEYKLDEDKIAPPVVIPVSHVTKRLLGKPEVMPVASNVFPAKVNIVANAGPPKLVIPGGRSYESPRVVNAIDSPYPSNPPEVTMVDAPHYPEQSTGLFSTIKARDGLNSEEISSLVNDKDGNLWIGQWWGGGISRYDGRFLWNYTIRQGLSSEVVNCIFQDSKGNMWMGSYDNGVNKFDGKYFTHYSTSEGLQHNFVSDILEDRAGNMWFATNNGLTKLAGRFFTHYTTAQGLPSNRIKSLMEDNEGKLWVGTDGGLARFDGHAFQTYTTALHFDERTEVSTLMEDSDGSIWFGTSNGLYKYEGDHIKLFTSGGGLGSSAILKIIKEKNGDIWIGTSGAGVARFDGDSFIHYRSEDGLPNNRVTSIVQDKWGNVWLGTTGGVAKYEGKMFTHVIPVKQKEIETLIPDKHGNIWMASGSDRCLNKYTGDSMLRYSAGNGLFNTAYNYLYRDKQDNMWFATWNGVDKYDGTYITHYSKESGLVDSVVFAVLEDRHDNIWFGTRKGLSKFDGKSFTNYSSDQGMIGEIIFTILEDHAGTLWLGTNDNGICKFDGKSFTYFKAGHGVSHPMIVGMMEDRENNLWICTGYGVNKFDGKFFTWYTTEQGLTNNVTKNVIQDTTGNIWIGCLTGLNRYTGNAMPADTSRYDAPSYFKNYTIAEGLSGMGTYENCMQMDNRGTIWIGTSDRLTQYQPDGDIEDTIAPVLKLTGISLLNEKIAWQEVKTDKINFSSLSPWYNQPENLELAHNNNALTFQFIGITTNRPKELRYRYKLEGADKTWTLTNQPVAVYSQLPHGKFNFRVQCVNSAGYWSNELNYAFIILPVWWQTKIAYFTYLMALVGIVWLFTWHRARRLKAENVMLERKVTTRTNELKQSLEERYRLNEQIKSQQALLNERLRISRDLHDEIGSTLGSISIYSEVAKKRSEKNQNPVTVLSKIGLASRELIEKMSDIVWSLNLNHENFYQMQQRMEGFARMILTPRNISHVFNVDENCKQVELSNAQTKNIFLIYKEALYNISKYAACTMVHIDFYSDSKNLMMTIRDNGKGFSQFVTGEPEYTSQSLGGNGIKNMYVRSEEIQSTLNVESKEDQGTTIRLTVPL